MNTYIEKYTMPYNNLPNESYDNICLKEPHESGDILYGNGRHWLILNSDLEGSLDIYPEGYYVVITDINYIEIFSSHQKDLEQRYKDLGIRLIKIENNYRYLYVILKDKTNED